MKILRIVKTDFILQFGRLSDVTFAMSKCITSNLYRMSAFLENVT